MIKGVIHSDKTIDNPSQYLNAVFGSYWTSMERVERYGTRSIRFTATDEVRRLCEVSRNIDISLVETKRWDDSPLTYREDEEALLTDDVPF